MITKGARVSKFVEQASRAVAIAAIAQADDVKTLQRVELRETIALASGHAFGVRLPVIDRETTTV